ncbi:glycosyl transferase, group 1 domain containing protein, putative [Eimeria maxima]|uniref:Alpha-1,3/1,6-mannosyltransferase ALG2 n=1 Tax=Eimeria maxima TaxID=5804 RepID=U6LZA6_EIMMA|nr:glycosyl transferase, group 1 domain containing protein, putative [Eimeria maxima]CDJ57307.1 glycosyl transferase, group 1 domain containing protein, putative [Eimeria maxima]
MPTKARRVAFFHLDLGVGGAEQLVLQTALQTHAVFEESWRLPCTVDVFTSYFDTDRCLEASRDPRLNIRVFGSFLPHAILGRFRVACSIVRMLYLVLAVIVTGHMGYDLVFNDQVAVVNPLLRLIGRKGTNGATRSKIDVFVDNYFVHQVIFYGHFPDLLLARRHPSLLRRVYRYPFDKLESWTTGMCDMVLVNSKFTAEAFSQTFSSFRKAKPRVLYPPVSKEVEAFQLRSVSGNVDASFSQLEGFDLSVPFATSLNRFEENKNVELAIRAVASLPGHIKCNLVIAGGFDPRLPECKSYFHRLLKLSMELNFRVLGCEDAVDANAAVPCEAMFVGILPVACNTGGPRETIVDGVTGFLCTPTPECFSATLERILLLSSQNPEELAAMCSNAQAHAARTFSPDVFRRSLKAIIADVTGICDNNCVEHSQELAQRVCTARRKRRVA